MALVAVSTIKYNDKVIEAGTTLKKGDVSEDALKELVAAGAVAPPKAPTAEQVKADTEERLALEAKLAETEAKLAEAEAKLAGAAKTDK